MAGPTSSTPRPGPGASPLSKSSSTPPPPPPAAAAAVPPARKPSAGPTSPSAAWKPASRPSSPPTTSTAAAAKSGAAGSPPSRPTSSTIKAVGSSLSRASSSSSPTRAAADAAGGVRPKPLLVPSGATAGGLGTPGPRTSTAKTPGTARTPGGSLLPVEDLGGERNFGSTEYWREQRPDVEDLAAITSDWFGDWDELKLLISRHMQCSDNVLLLGPGSCTLHEQLYDSGWRNLTVLDNCAAALEPWKIRSTVLTERQSMRFHVADPVEGLGYDRFPYQAIIDKGVLDCILCREEGWSQAEAAIANLKAALASPGTLLFFSHGPPSRRLPLLRSVRWTNITVKQLVEPPLTQQGPVCATLPACVMLDCPLSGPNGGTWPAEPPAGSVEAARTAGYIYICKHSLA